MSFETTSNQFAIFLFFFVLGVKFCIEQKIFLIFKIFLTNKIVKVFFGILNVFVIIVNCAQFYFLALKMNFGIIRFFMFVAFFAGVAILLLFWHLISNLIKIKKQKMTNN